MIYTNSYWCSKYDSTQKACGIEYTAGAIEFAITSIHQNRYLDARSPLITMSSVIAP